ncbi:MAG: hypothetical protein OEV66_07130 [Spirochaetia bacterium]|nr:hypothetical protein [Spirochaetia bacterium]
MAENEKFEADAINSNKLSIFLEKFNFNLDQMEKDLMQLEKEYFSLTPYYEKIFERLENMEFDARENRASLLSYRIKHLLGDVIKFHKNSGYNIDGFNHLFKSLRSVKTRLPDEIFSEDALKMIREKVKLEAARWIPSGLPQKSDLHKYLALENDGTHYLIAFKKKIWEKQVENKSRVKIQIKSLPGDNTFSFKSLPGNTEKQASLKLAVLIENEAGEKTGILTEKIEGVMIFSGKFLKKNTDYFPISDGGFAPYLTLKGMRYFIRKD